MAASAIASATGQSMHRLLCQLYMHSMLMLGKSAQAGICLDTTGNILQRSTATDRHIEFRPFAAK